MGQRLQKVFVYVTSWANHPTGSNHPFQNMFTVSFISVSVAYISIFSDRFQSGWIKTVKLVNPVQAKDLIALVDVISNQLTKVRFQGGKKLGEGANLK